MVKYRRLICSFGNIFVKKTIIEICFSRQILVLRLYFLKVYVLFQFSKSIPTLLLPFHNGEYAPKGDSRYSGNKIRKKGVKYDWRKQVTSTSYSLLLPKELSHG